MVEQRRTRRFTLQLPLSITRNGTERVMHLGLTKNISSGGVLFTAENEPDIGVSIEYVITLAGAVDQGVNLRCIGKVLRSNPSDSIQAGYDIAATLERYEFLRPEE
ncbi:MAG TPA: PilZ domain-containing protein [Bryobacteraceae bacterium]|nr:PilZ domain-containing protein [Bryobacteraceae bacterium]